MRILNNCLSQQILRIFIGNPQHEQSIKEKVLNGQYPFQSSYDLIDGHASYNKNFLSETRSLSMDLRYRYARLPLL